MYDFLHFFYLVSFCVLYLITSFIFLVYLFNQFLLLYHKVSHLRFPPLSFLYFVHINFTLFIYLHWLSCYCENVHLRRLRWAARPRAPIARAPSCTYVTMCHFIHFIIISFFCIFIYFVFLLILCLFFYLFCIYLFIYLLSFINFFYSKILAVRRFVGSFSMLVLFYVHFLFSIRTNIFFSPPFL